MKITKKKAMTPKEIGSLGGLTCAKNLGKAGRKARAKRAAAARWAKAKKGTKK